ncbi:hypothetical protein [Ulvibacter litoralis]|nr:hypothetical protein [Ulvibacter litoralis]
MHPFVLIVTEFSSERNTLQLTKHVPKKNPPSEVIERGIVTI